VRAEHPLRIEVDRLREYRPADPVFGEPVECHECLIHPRERRTSASEGQLVTELMAEIACRAVV
jgi:hypothetical protein